MIEITLTQFTPGQAEKITGVSVVQQRNLRRHGYLISNEGHARFNAFGLARLLAIQILADRGIGPALTAKADDGFDIASIIATGILSSLFGWVDAYEGDHLSFKPGLPPRTSEPLDEATVDQLLAAAARTGIRLTREQLLNSEWQTRSEILKRRALTAAGCGRVIPARFLIWWANGKHVWEFDLQKAFGDTSDDPRYHGATIVIDQDAVASMLLERAGAPFAHVEEIADK